MKASTADSCTSSGRISVQLRFTHGFHREPPHPVPEALDSLFVERPRAQQGLVNKDLSTGSWRKNSIPASLFLPGVPPAPPLEAR